jgi:perosamine synthetase|tara:strand:- start:65 stop:1204 length:1140 start_codon:yes stop_codon:yes gene_type:complete
MKRILDMAGPDITQHEIDTVVDAMKTGWYEKPYYYVEKFQSEFAKYHNRKFAVMTPNCTTAIHLLLSCLGVGEGDEVIAPECTWIASVAPITYLKAKTVFCDIDKDNWCSDPKSIEDSITDKTKAIIVVDLFGNMPHMDEIIKISEKYNIPLIEDAAESLGSTYKGIRAGKFGIGSVFSFHRTKTLTTGEGGMLLLDDEELYKKCMIWRDHGRDGALPKHMRNPNTKMYFNDYITYKYMPFNLQAAIGYAQFERIDELVWNKKYQLEFYRNELSDVDDLTFNEESDTVENGAWITSMVIGKSHNIDKETFIDKMEKLEIPIRPFFYPLSMLPPFNIEENKYKNTVSYDVSARGVNLPGSARLTDDDMKFICDGIKKVLK